METSDGLLINNLWSTNLNSYTFVLLSLPPLRLIIVLPQLAPVVNLM